MQLNKNKYIILFLISVLIIGLDQITKYFICKLLPLYSQIEVIDGFFNIVHVRNSGVAFGLFKRFGSEYRLVSMLVVFLIVVFLIFFLVAQLKRGCNLQAFSLSLILGGAVGNLIDRMLIGEVVDFIDIHWAEVYHWPAFNVADSAITVGIMLIIFDELFLSRKREREIPPA
jgi:signal peptidase II